MTNFMTLSSRISCMAITKVHQVYFMTVEAQPSGGPWVRLITYRITFIIGYYYYN